MCLSIAPAPTIICFALMVQNLWRGMFTFGADIWSVTLSNKPTTQLSYNPNAVVLVIIFMPRFSS